MLQLIIVINHWISYFDSISIIFHCYTHCRSRSFIIINSLYKNLKCSWGMIRDLLIIFTHKILDPKSLKSSNIWLQTTNFKKSYNIFTTTHLYQIRGFHVDNPFRKKMQRRRLKLIITFVWYLLQWSYLTSET